MRALVILAAIALAGCAFDRDPEIRGESAPIEVHQVDLRPMCGTVKDYSPADQVVLAKAIDALPGDSPIIPVIGDYKRMRDEARACQSSASQ